MFVSVLKGLDGGIFTMTAIVTHPPTSHAHSSLTSSNSMTLVSNDPSWWPTINAARVSSYFIVAASAGLMYDWVLTFGQEVELVWRQRWSLMTFLYLIVRYIGILYTIITVLIWVPTTDVVSFIMYFVQDWMSLVINLILGVVMIARLHAMYQRSRKVLIVLVVVLLAVTIADGVIIAISMRDISAEELILFDTYQCTIDYKGNVLPLDTTVSWILPTVWDVLALCLAVWIAVKHFRERRRQSARGIIWNCFTVLMKTHLFYFASVLAVSCFNLLYISPTILADQFSMETKIYLGFLDVFLVVKMFVLGPRLILGVREYYDKLMAESDAATHMTSMAFQEHVHVSTSNNV
ncbi:uncharacterized protein EDB91DRAFT_206035 [Suillus paluster]|uniref:uncharacterized protein n=1 Tax=Suillus paluster TaxID=48578 RepID=UPI001B873448|nr:uncharacterized protein EDB91DRAFT_206035 [Suillus paluster]KAG1743954.1 hypothetical protein EDB91DRAFT_206035 [Suillus paluster]